MKMLKKGTAHIGKAYEVTCDFCESKFRFLEEDPMYKLDWNVRYGMYEIKFVCPVCKQKNHLAERDYEAYAVPGGLEVTNYYHLTREDKEELNINLKMTLEDIMTYLSELSDADLEFIGKTDVIKARHADEYKMMNNI